ncbi:type IA DNA topoisomerase [Flavobacterium humi]|uniref:DNA topoisomerase n=1 Tax=Flavobacterium humi TaxID=2562683 RepID=A0A4Z0L920_9FLAO|nr:type IA DNA topoisomerase [Flavobacterium humi]TGD58955.1 type IA DNA topoisomerase [Flavobacterium humi]
MKAVIAEKPSVAREIALLLGATNKDEGVYSGNGYMVTWALGHLVGLGMPEDYGISGFQKDALPILPKPFLLKIRRVKKEKGYVTDIGASKQLKIIEQVIKQCDSIIVATDAGREGELIFRYIYQYLKCKKPFERLWISSLTEKAIKQGFDNLKPGIDFDGLYLAAQARSRADWLVGINASQALSISAGNTIYSLGRVQTPTLALICKRYLENKSFKIQTYWQLQLIHQKDYINFLSLSKNKWNDKKQAESIFKSIQRSMTASVISIESKTITEHPPLLFDLTGLQKEANKKLNLSAEEALAIAQSLYEKRFITYPRTGSKYIPEDLWPEVSSLIRTLETRNTCREGFTKIKFGQLNKRIVNDLKVTDHHGLLITEKKPSALSAKENAIYDIIALRLLEAVSETSIKEITDITLQVLHYDFSVKGCKVVQAGWRTIKGCFFDEDNEHTQDLPSLKVGDELKVKDVVLLEKKTKPPVLYTEAGLLSAMESAGKEIENEEERKALLNIGIGTPATRAAIIEILFTRNYIQREKKSLVPTEKGVHVYNLVKDKKIADVSMTAEWELTLEKIENNQIDTDAFQKGIEEYVVSITQELLNTAIVTEILPVLNCPKCNKQHLLIKDILVKCPDDICKWVQFRNICGVNLSVTDLENLINKGKTTVLKDMKSKSGKKFNASIVLNENGKTTFEFEGDKKIVYRR